MNVHTDDIFCSSLPGMSIPTGTAFVDYIKLKVAAPDLVLLVISPEFLKSQFCNNEVGASWASLLVPPTDCAGNLGTPGNFVAGAVFFVVAR